MDDFIITMLKQKMISMYILYIFVDIKIKQKPTNMHKHVSML